MGKRIRFPTYVLALLILVFTLCLGACTAEDRGNGVSTPPSPIDSHFVIGVGAIMPNGSHMLFDGTQGKATAIKELQAKWQDWIPNVTEEELSKYTSARNSFKIAKDPLFPDDTNRVTLQSCCRRAWGYDDIQSVFVHGDAHIHVEFILMGQYDSLENPNALDAIGVHQAGYNNSGVYVQSRYEVQIFSWGQNPAKLPNKHGMGALVDEYAATKNPNRANGVWQSYDIVFRSARYTLQGKQMAPAYLTVWWNGERVHDNRPTYGKATGLANHSGEELNPILYGLKIQSEGTDVRYRNIWIKDLTLN